jgi:GT2 family glycosyltransferase
MSSPLVDVVVPLYNKAEVVARTVLSVLGQTFGNFRLIVVDDGSTDGGADRVPRDPRITLMRQANAGPGAARNRGLHEGAAPFVAFVDADDEWLPAFLDTTLSTLQTHPDSAAVGVSWFWGPERENRAPRHCAQGIFTGQWRCPVDLPSQQLKDAVDFCASSAVLARREAVERLGGFYDRCRATYGEDSFLWLRLLMQQPMYRLVEPLIWIHTEHSALGAGRRTPYPVPPILRHVEEVLAQCPPSHRALLRSYLDWYALMIAHRLAQQGQGRSARRLLRRGEHVYSAGDPQTKTLYDRTCLLARFWPAVRLRNFVRRGWPGFRLRPWDRRIDRIAAGDS